MTTTNQARIEDLEKLEKEADESHGEFNDSMTTICASILTVSITTISIFTGIKHGVLAIKLSWISFVLILILIGFYKLINAERMKVTFSLSQLKNKMIKSGDAPEYYKENKLSVDNEIKYAERFVKMHKIIFRFGHFIVFTLFLIGMIFLMIFTIKNINSNQPKQNQSTQPTIINNYYGEQNKAL